MTENEEGQIKGQRRVYVCIYVRVCVCLCDFSTVCRHLLIVKGRIGFAICSKYFRYQFYIVLNVNDL